MSPSTRLEAFSETGEFSISEITRQYVSEGKAQIRNIGTTTWIDCGTRNRCMMLQSWQKEGKSLLREVDV